MAVAIARKRNPEIIALPPSALRVIALSVGIEMEAAREIVRALAKAGYVVAPMEPTNSMFAAYLEALNMPPTRHETAIRSIGKARKRWKAMAQAGLAVTFCDDLSPSPVAHGNQGEHVEALKPSPSPQKTEG